MSYRRKDVPNSRLGNLARINISKGKAGGEVLTRVSSLEILPTYLYSRDARNSDGWRLSWTRCLGLASRPIESILRPAPQS